MIILNYDILIKFKDWTIVIYTFYYLYLNNVMFFCQRAKGRPIGMFLFYTSIINVHIVHQKHYL